MDGALTITFAFAIGAAIGTVIFAAFTRGTRRITLPASLVGTVLVIVFASYSMNHITANSLNGEAEATSVNDQAENDSDSLAALKR